MILVIAKGEGRERGWEAERHSDTLTETVRDREKGENSNSKTLFYKDCSLGSFKSMSN